MHTEAPDLPKLVLRGTPKEIGLQHGYRLQQQIKSQIGLYEEMFQYTSKMDWPTVLQLAEEFRASLERKTPSLYAEMQGIAEGAGVDILDIIALNCRSEISLGSFSDGCTSLSWKKNDNARVLAQNWDWTSSIQKNLALMDIEISGKPRICMVAEAGIIGKIGFNSAGVGTCLNAIKARPCITSKVPIHVALRLCLESTSVENALQTLSSLGGVASSQHILIADSTTSLGLELSPLGDLHLKEDENGVITHTNHFIENKNVTEPSWIKGSPARLERAQQLVRELVNNGIQGDSITPSLLREQVFSDTCNAPQSICSQEDPSSHPTRRTSTLFNIVMNLDKQDLGAEVVVGQPGSGKESPVIKMPWM
ncbi:putative acyl-CoA:6-aminopenicillanic-acid-acyltransferase [Aspergillus bombycis]|uniref:Putative acyl-CoA:6-aminopenicillanic-acid-acyltransferase n=1 Tax=Aspergillus bombycis TaxID=109264 RepID=A0A1F7ZVA6_9EURO|nr:putative acyl-CoA:6-aminopenicillanic-acid-acyltransferase [Aspergillus bombycis]OGM43390.1 putative acyl-CoA:6-aminopenicillanic-acid-acyltransferase [Aspergillus bombycis]